MNRFRVESEFQPAGDQPAAIAELVAGFRDRRRPHQTLMGVTGSGKTFTVANVIEQLNLPTLVICHNKTLAAQLYAELKGFLPDNAVEYFVSYYDYYQPEAYVPQRDIYIEKDSSINEDIDRLRMAATNSLLTRSDTVIVASVSSIYGLGSPSDYKRMMVAIERGGELDRDELLEQLVMTQYTRNDIAWERGCFRVRGDVVEIKPTYAETAFRVEFFGDEVDGLFEVDTITGELVREFDKLTIWPAKHHVVPEDRLQIAIGKIEQELEQHLVKLRKSDKLLEAQRLEARTRNDLELLAQIGRCPGIENYSLHMTDREPGSRPYCLLDFFPRPFLCVVDESHVTLPQVRGMYHGDRSRKQTLVDHGFRLPSAMDNRPLEFDEWIEIVGERMLFVSATPADYELEACGGVVTEQIIRPTGLLDPVVEVQPAKGQIDHLKAAIDEVVERKERVLVTTLTKRLAEDVSDYLNDEGYRSHFMHSELDAMERVELLRGLRAGEFDVLVGVNLLREGLDLPEVSLVAILDADKQGFLRNETSLVQTIGRAARNVNARVVMYGEQITPAMQSAIDETERRRAIQQAHNEANGITPESVIRAVKATIEDRVKSLEVVRKTSLLVPDDSGLDDQAKDDLIEELDRERIAASDAMDYERAIALRDRIAAIRAGEAGAVPKPKGRKRRRRSARR